MDEVRVKRGLTYGISTSLASYNKASVMVGSVATRADAVRQTIQVVRETLAEFAANGPTQQELDDAKTYLTGSFPLAFASNSGTASQLGTFQRQNLDIGYVGSRNSMIQAVTLADVKRVAKHLFDPVRLTVVIGGSPTEARGPQHPVPLPPGNPPQATAQTQAITPQGVTPAPNPANKPLTGPVTAPKAAKKP
jgi:zinc protease